MEAGVASFRGTLSLTIRRCLILFLREEINPLVQQQELPPQPDPDAIKMFVGQIPRSWDENELRNLFEEFGKVHSVNVLRDKVTGNSRGEFPKSNVLLNYLRSPETTHVNSLSRSNIGGFC